MNLLMKLFCSLFRPAAAGCLLCLFCAVLPLPVTAAEKTGQEGINLPDVDFEEFIRIISEITGKKFIVDPAVRGKITVIAPEGADFKSMSKEDAWQIFESVLDVHGYATVPSGALTKIVPSVQARSKSIPTIQGAGRTGRADDKMVTRIIQITHSSPEEVKKIVGQLVSKSSVVIAHDQSGVLIITDVLSNINRLMEIIKAVDVPSQGEELAIIPLKYASVAALSKSLGQLFVQSAVRGGIPPTAIKIIPYERTNSLIVFAPRTQIDKIRSLLEQLDREVTTEGGNIHVYYLQHANAEELVKVLTSLPSKSKQADEADSKIVQPKAGEPQTQAKTEPPKPETHAAQSVQLSADMKITADPETNALIVTASQDEYMALEEIIKQLDIPRRMVYLEALIMEVSVDRQFDIGAEWGGLGSFHDETGTLGSGFTDTSFSLINGISKGTAGMVSGATLGVLKKGVKIGGIYFPDLGAVLNTFQKDSDINIIATPQILTTDNKEASITVGENVPYITSKNSSESGSSQDYTNYEYKDVGTTLKITPQINQANLLRLEIGVEVTRLKSEAGVTTPTTYKRTAATTVVVHNQEIVVIGGMIGQDTTSGDYKVPLLGDIPLLGWLFKSHEDSRKKTNMFIFIAPRIVESSPQLADVYYKKRDVLEEVQEGSGAVPEHLLQTKLRQEDVFALLDKGTAKLQAKESAEAKAYFQQALENAPENPYALLNLAAVYAQEGDKDKAAAACRQVLAQAGQGTDAALLKAAQERLRQLEQETPKQKEEPKPERKEQAL